MSRLQAAASRGTSPVESLLIGASTVSLLLAPIFIRVAVVFMRGTPPSRTFRQGLSTGAIAFYGILAAWYFAFIWGVH